MASVTSLGLHRPTGLSYLIQEGLLPTDPPPDAYKWDAVNCEREGVAEDDEIVRTDTCVVWSTGGVVQKSFRFEVEDEPVTRALLTYFPAHGDNRSRKRSGEAKSGNKRAPSDNDHNGRERIQSKDPATRKKSKALVVFLRTQAHVFFLSGTSHVIHLPFEVEHVSAAPYGLIIQRKPMFEHTATTSLKLPIVPPNSSITAQSAPWSATSSIRSTFSIASLGSPKQLNLKHASILPSPWDMPGVKGDANWPRLFSLTDPFAEMGLIAADTRTNDRRQPLNNALALDSAEELIHITDCEEFSSIQPTDNDPLILAVTLNRVTCHYTVWKVRYLEQDEISKPRPKTSNAATARRRSSFIPGAGSGTTTTAITGQYAFRESIGGPPGKTSLHIDDNPREGLLDLATALDPEFEEKGMPRRRSRRVSSFLARGDLSTSHDKGAFHELGTSQQHQSKRRGESLSGQHARKSFGVGVVNNHMSASHFGTSLNSLLAPAPVDNLLDELRAGGDFEGFHDMGLEDEDFEGLRKEIFFSKIESLPTQHTNLHFFPQEKSLPEQHTVFTLLAPKCASEDPRKGSIIVCILNSKEKNLTIIPLATKTRPHSTESKTYNKARNLARDSITITAASPKRASKVLDAVKVQDGSIMRILVLTETSDGYGDLTLQAPWSTLIKIHLPRNLAVGNIRGLSYDETPQKRRDGGLRRILSDGVRALRSLRRASARGKVDVMDEEGKYHQIKITMEPRHPFVKKVIDVCRSVLPGSRCGEAVLVCWWNVRQWLHESSHPLEDDEWTALAVVLLSIVLGAQDQEKPEAASLESHWPGDHVRSSSLLTTDNDNWQSMLSVETLNSGSRPGWLANAAWQWLDEEELIPPITSQLSGRHVRQKSISPLEIKEAGLQHYLSLTKDFLSTRFGEDAFGANGESYMPTARHRDTDFRANCITDLLTGLHLFREEQKLDITTVDALNTNNVDLVPILTQLFNWVGWKKWAAIYESQDAATSAIDYDLTKVTSLPEPPHVPDVYQWIESCFVSKRLGSFVTIADITLSRSVIGHQDAPHQDQWSSLTPRTSLFLDFFSHIFPDSSPIEMIQALHDSGLTIHLLETLPEAILVPLRESVIVCQAQPSVSWHREILSLVDRSDVNLLLSPGANRPRMYTSNLAPTHEASVDVHGLCHGTQDVEAVGSFDGSAEVDRQGIIRLIFKDDRRFSEAASILNTSKPKVARVEQRPEWSESELLEAQKEHVVMLATRTLATPTGRGLLYFNARVPLLTEKFPIGGFNLHCIMTPSNNTVGVEKMNFTEEKVCWAFFHSGVAAGLSISRAAKGIDTSWILYNKPQENSNRHAGFLLALGLNGHLKNVTKWTAFKYLTPKHPMTSIGLLLGLAASYLGTMDSYFTRVISVHVTRMLPPGSAELNLSPLTQTAGVMSIGLLYCNTQHRRMSEIMLSEVEHIEHELEDEPLRNEGYRLASGCALGLINLGKGSDLRGLHDMHLMERLLRIAVGSKKVDLVHILDKSTAAAIVAIALIFMKSENIPLARKIDIPESHLQYDYVRPDMFLLRTLARHLIMWNEIQPTQAWMKQMLPKAYQFKSDLTAIYDLVSEDLHFYNIITGLLFSIALRFAGSGSLQVRDLILHYLDQMSRICKLPATDFDQKLTRNTVRNCLDLISLSVASVMAGTGDLASFRRLRALHGRDDAETPYGSHLAAHMAVGALFLGGGTHTFGTSNLAVGSLIIAFYPLFPSTILDNKSHLQAFRHFWVMAAEPRCLVPRDLNTNRPVSIPICITLKTGVQSNIHAPCLLPDLNLISSVSTSSQDYWNIMLDFGTDDRIHKMFTANQTILVRRKQASDSGMPVFHATLQALDTNFSLISSGKSSSPLEWLFKLSAFHDLTKAERTLVLGRSETAASEGLGMDTTVVDARLVLEKASLMSGKRDRLQGLKLLFAWKDACEKRGEGMKWLKESIIDGLRAKVWLLENQNMES